MNSRHDPAPSLLVLAAGHGTRYGGLKQLDPVGPGGTTLLDYALADAHRAGCARGVVVVRREIEEDIETHLAGTAAKRMPVTCVVQDPEDVPPCGRSGDRAARAWGTAHAVWCARGALQGPFVVANADDYYGREAYRAVAEELSAPTGPGEQAGPSPALSDPGHWVLAGYRLENTLSRHGPVNRGLCTLGPRGDLEDIWEGVGLQEGDGEVTGLDERGEPVTLPVDAWVSTNLWGFTADLFDLLRKELAHVARPGRDNPVEWRLPDVVRRAIRSGSARVLVRSVESDYFGITHPEDRSDVVDRLAEVGPPWGSPPLVPGPEPPGWTGAI